MVSSSVDLRDESAGTVANVPRKRAWQTPRVIVSDMRNAELASYILSDNKYTHS